MVVISVASLASSVFATIAKTSRSGLPLAFAVAMLVIPGGARGASGDTFDLAVRSWASSVMQPESACFAEVRTRSHFAAVGDVDAEVEERIYRLERTDGYILVDVREPHSPNDEWAIRYIWNGQYWLIANRSLSTYTFANSIQLPPPQQAIWLFLGYDEPSFVGSGRLSGAVLGWVGSDDAHEVLSQEGLATIAKKRGGGTNYAVVALTTEPHPALHACGIILFEPAAPSIDDSSASPDSASMFVVGERDPDTASPKEAAWYILRAAPNRVDQNSDAFFGSSIDDQLPSLLQRGLAVHSGVEFELIEKRAFEASSEWLSGIRAPDMHAGWTVVDRRLRLVYKIGEPWVEYDGKRFDLVRPVDPRSPLPLPKLKNPEEPR